MSNYSDPNIKETILQRLRFEQNLGLDCVRPVGLSPAKATPHSPDVSISPPESPSGEESNSVKERWNRIEEQVKVCTGCVLHKERTYAVFGEGNRSARLVFVGEGPGYDEDQSGRPFVGKAGQLLNKIIKAMGWPREDVFICNVIKCRPPNNRTPLPDEIDSCQPFLTEQLDLIRPQAIVALGAPAARTLTGTKEGITAMRGRWRMYRSGELEIRVMPTFHPAYVLREYTERTRRAVWDDMKQVKMFLES